MSYTRQSWVDGSLGGTPINAARLQHIEDGLAAHALSLPNYNVEDYGAVGGNPAHDDGPGILAAVQAMNASSTGGYLVFPRAVTYYANADNLLQHWSDGQYAMFPIPLVPTNSTHPQKFFGIRAPGLACLSRNWSGSANVPTPVALNNAGTVLQISYSTPKAYSNSFGIPSVFGCVDYDKGGLGGYFSNVFVEVQGLTIRQPSNPSMCALNLEKALGASVPDFMAEGVDAPVLSGSTLVSGGYDLTPQPTHPTGATILWPANGNATICVAGRVGAWGMFAGPGVGEHIKGSWLYAVRCQVAHPTRERLVHLVNVEHTVTEECPFIVAGWDPVAGVVAAHAVHGTWWLDVEDYGSGALGTWTQIKSAVYDPSNNLGGHMTVGLFDGVNGLGFNAKGGSSLTFTSMYTGAQFTPAPTGVDPVPASATVPGAPTIGTASPAPGGAAVAFTAPASNGGAAIISYTATASPGGLTGSGTSSPVSVAGLTSGTVYTFTVHATNGVGNSVESAASNSVTVPSAALLFDSFNRADNPTSLGSPTSGGPWVIGTGAVWGTVLNGAYTPSTSDGGYGFAWAECNQANVTLTTVVFVSGTFDGGPVFRVQDKDNLMAFIIGDGAGTPLGGLFRRTAGAFTKLQDATGMPALPSGTPHTIVVTTSGTHIVVKVNGTTVVDFTGTTGLESATKHGLTDDPAVPIRFDSIQVA